MVSTVNLRDIATLPSVTQCRATFFSEFKTHGLKSIKQEKIASEIVNVY